MADYTEWIENGIRYRRFTDGALEEVPVDVIIESASPRLTISLDQEIVTTGTLVTATAEVRDENNNLVDISGTYYVPVIRNADNLQAKLLEVAFSNGQASVEFAINEPGIYSVALDKVYPPPQSELAESPVLVVKAP